MCPPRERLDSITVLLGASHEPVGCVVVHHAQTDHEVIQPLGVGPFDTPAEVYQRALEVLEVQLTLW